MEKEMHENKPMTRFEVFKTMGVNELREVLEELDNRYGGLCGAILVYEDAEEVAREVEDWFCPEPSGRDDPSRQCGACIEAWLNAPYDAADPLGLGGE